MAELVTLARPYAQAIFKLALEKKQLPAWSKTLANLLELVSEKSIAALIKDVTVGKQDLSDVLVEVSANAIDKQGKNLLRLLVENGRLMLLAEIAVVYELLRAEQEGAIEAEVITAFPLTEAMGKKIASALKARLGKKVNINAVIDKSVIGGAIIRAGDLVIDGSTSGKLDKLSYAMSV